MTSKSKKVPLSDNYRKLAYNEVIANTEKHDIRGSVVIANIVKATHTKLDDVTVEPLLFKSGKSKGSIKSLVYIDGMTEYEIDINKLKSGSIEIWVNKDQDRGA